MSTATRAKPTGLLPLLVRPATAPFYRINEVMGDRTPGVSVNVVETETWALRDSNPRRVD
jgi:hypothetical protein